MFHGVLEHPFHDADLVPRLGLLPRQLILPPRVGPRLLLRLLRGALRARRRDRDAERQTRDDR